MCPMEMLMCLLAFGDGVVIVAYGVMDSVSIGHHAVYTTIKISKYMKCHKTS